MSVIESIERGLVLAPNTVTQYRTFYKVRDEQGIVEAQARFGFRVMRPMDIDSDDVAKMTMLDTAADAKGSAEIANVGVRHHNTSASVEYVFYALCR